MTDMDVPRDDPVAMMALATKIHEENLRRRQRRPWIRVYHAVLHACTSKVALKEGLKNAYLVFSHRGLFVSWWDSFLILGVVYSTAYSPLAIVFADARWDYHGTVDLVLDILFMMDVMIRFRTSVAA